MSLKSHGHNLGLHVYLFIILLVVVHPALTVLHYRLEPRRQTINFYGLKGSSLLLIILEKKNDMDGMMSMKLFTYIVKFMDPWARGSGTLCRANIAHSVKILNCSVTRVIDNLFELVSVRRQALSVVRIQFYFNILKIQCKL